MKDLLRFEVTLQWSWDHIRDSINKITSRDVSKPIKTLTTCWRWYYEAKLKILNYCDENPDVKKKDVASHFDIAPSSLSEIFKNRDKIKEKFLAEDRPLVCSGVNIPEIRSHRDTEKVSQQHA